MPKIFNIFKSVEQNYGQSTELIENLLSDNSDLPLSSEEALILQSSIITVINTRLNHSATRSEGLKILLRVLPRCSREQLAKFSFLWMGKATKLLENAQSPPKDVDLSCKILSKLVISCKEIPELHKQISMQSVKNLVGLIVNMNDEKRTGGIFFVIATLLFHYRESCERHQSSIRSLLISQIDNKSRYLVQAAANCFALLSKAIERSFKPPVKFAHYTSGVYYQILICNDLHLIMDDLFTGILELDTVEIGESLNLSCIPQEDVIEYYNKVERRFQNLCVYLATILRGCSGKNSVSCSTIIKLVCRGLAVTPENLQREDSYKNQILYVILPMIHMGLLNVLNAFICGFHRELVPFAVTILQLYRQTLKWTRKIEEVTISGCRPFTNIRINTYRSLSLWLNCLGTLSGVDMIASDILADILEDVTPEKDQVLLTIQNTQNMSKKAFKKLKNSQYEYSTALGAEDCEQKIERNPVVNAGLCREALTVVQNILYNSGVVLGSVVHRVLQKLVVNLLMNFYLGRDDQSLYSKDYKCRLNLLKTLRAIQMNPNPLTAPPTQYSVEIFQMAINDEDNEIVAEAKVALAEVEKIVHPSAATLDSCIGQSQDKNAENSECFVREKNGDAVGRKPNIVTKIDGFKDWIKALNDSSGKAEENNFEGKEINGMERGLRDERPEWNEAEMIKGLGDDDVEVIEQAKEPPRKQRKIQIIEDICLPPPNYVPLKTPSIEEIPQELPEKCAQNSYDSARGQTAYFTIKEAQRVSANSSMSSDQPVEIIKEISVFKEISILEDEFKDPRRDDGSDDDEVILSMFCDQIKE